MYEWFAGEAMRFARELSHGGIRCGDTATATAVCAVRAVYKRCTTDKRRWCAELLCPRACFGNEREVCRWRRVTIGRGGTVQLAGEQADRRRCGRREGGGQWKRQIAQRR